MLGYYCLRERDAKCDWHEREGTVQCSSYCRVCKVLSVILPTVFQDCNHQHQTSVTRGIEDKKNENATRIKPMFRPLICSQRRRERETSQWERESGRRREKERERQELGKKAGKNDYQSHEDWEERSERRDMKLQRDSVTQKERTWESVGLLLLFACSITTTRQWEEESKEVSRDSPEKLAINDLKLILIPTKESRRE